MTPIPVICDSCHQLWLADHVVGVDAGSKAEIAFKHARGPIPAFVQGFEDSRPIDVPQRGARPPAFGRDLPMTAARAVEEATEHRSAVEARRAEPIDRAVTAHQRGSATISDQPVGGQRLVCALDQRTLPVNKHQEADHGRQRLGCPIVNDCATK